MAHDNVTSEDLRSLLRGGQFKRAREILATREDACALIERARLAFFLDNDHDETLRLAEQVQSAHDASAGQRLLGRILDRLVAAAQEEPIGAVIDAQDLASVEQSMVAEVVYFAAYAAYVAHDLATAEAWLHFHKTDSPEWQARYLVLGGTIAAANERLLTQAELTSEALDILESRAPDHIVLIANAARHLAVLARDVPRVDAIDRLERILKRIGDDDGFTGSRFHVVRSLGWSHAVRGDYETAMRFVLRSTFEATNDIERLYAHLDHAATAVFAHEQAGSAARAAFAIARDLMNSIPWNTVVTDDLVALPLAAQVAAEFGAAAEAKRYCELAAQMRGHIIARLPLAHDGRYEAFLNEAVSLAYADADRRRAMAAAADAYETYKHIGFAWRAARMAILLYQLTRNPKWKARALAHLEAYPKSPFHRLLERPRALTKRQEDVLELVRLGFDDDRIAYELGISYKTVRIHVGRLFHWYGVKNRSALMAKAVANAV